MTTEQAGVVPEWTLQDRLRKARELTGLSQGQFAERLGVSRNTVGSAESGAVEVRRITLNAWAMATGVSIEWLMTGEGSPTPGPGRGLPEDEKARRLAALAASKRGHGVSTEEYAPAA